MFINNLCKDGRGRGVYQMFIFTYFIVYYQVYLLWYQFVVTIESKDIYK